MTWRGGGVRTVQVQALLQVLVYFGADAPSIGLQAAFQRLLDRQEADYPAIASTAVLPAIVPVPAAVTGPSAWHRIQTKPDAPMLTAREVGA